MFEITAYTPDQAEVWNRMVAASRNGTFLFDRNYMDYHADRFPDASLMVRRDGELLALLPASRRGDTLGSHPGLTYGGFVVDERMTTPLMLEMMTAVRDHLRAAGLRRWSYKTVPSVFHRVPSEEDRYALFRCDARLVRRDALSVIPREQDARAPRQERRRRGARKAERAGVAVGRSEDWAGFWEVLEGRLGERYAVRPVHTLDEIRLLAGRFPDRISLHLATLDGRVLAGVVCYDTGTVLHAQYISATVEGRDCGAQDLLFVHLIDRVFAGQRWFSFGISNEQDGRVLNAGLIDYKEGFGARTMVHDFYELDLG